MDFQNLPNSPPGKLILESESGRLEIGRESGRGADWRITLNNINGDHLSTEFSWSGMRSQYTVGAIAFLLHQITEPDLDLSHLPISANVESSRLSDSDYILVTLKLVLDRVMITLEALRKNTELDTQKISGSWKVDEVQKLFFGRLMGAMEQDNLEKPLEIPE